MSCALEPFCACVIDANDDVIKLCAPHQDVVDKAVAAERAACAKIVHERRGADEHGEVKPGTVQWAEAHACQLVGKDAAEIAFAIMAAYNTGVGQASEMCDEKDCHVSTACLHIMICDGESEPVSFAGEN